MGVLLAMLVLSACERWVSEPVSISVTGTTGNASSHKAVFSPDGTKIAFTSRASNLGATDTNGRQDVYLRDVDTGEATLVSTNTAGTDSGDQESVDPVFSPDGTKIAFTSRASNLGATDTNDDYDVYMHDLTTGRATLVSYSLDGSAAGGLQPTFGPDGEKIAFMSWGSTFGPTDTNGASDVYLKDLAEDTTTLVSVNASGTDAGNDQSVQPAFSPDGTKVAFTSQSSDLDPDVTNWQSGNDVFVRDLAGGFTLTVSTDATRTEDANGPSFSPAWSPDSRRILFASKADNLGPVDTSSLMDYYLRDVRTGGIWRLPVDRPEDDDWETEEPVPGALRDPAFSADGTRIVFVSWTNDLMPGDFDGEPEAFVYSLTTRLFQQVSAGSDGSPYAPSFNRNATKVVYATTATDAVGGDKNGAAPDVVVIDLAEHKLTRVSTRSNPLESANGPSYDATFNPQDDTVVFTSDASDIAKSDTNGQPDIFIASFVKDDDDS